MYAVSRTLVLGVAGIFEALIGVVLIVVPGVVSELLLGSAEISPEALVFGRMMGAALLCIGVASWLSRSDSRSAVQRAQLVGLAIYYSLGAIVLAYAGVALNLAGVLLWPAVLVHVLLAAWCLVCLREPGALSGHAG
ncbi:hypothetical protein SAZ10_14030 [Mesorhizobium sp. BAC0120]|uniref:hypothetical protein n=1 Tax=Mesorhizobium sp. BAC0120 TaxID=3090670 RepID=UPI00298D1ED0|nr:hypothetical protein [Mesorhizobium sp. BAC0120]MDW6022879.1 hypothetical protein [Mesorhizobium sp. BAC0120]